MLLRAYHGPMRRLVWVAVLVAGVLVALDVVEPAYVFGPLLGLLILRVGLATFGSLRAGSAAVPDGPPVPVDPALERVVYACGGCGAEVLLLVRGTQVAPRHCGERMTGRVEVPRGRQAVTPPAEGG
jgi:DNA-directed RNA polymerase subunit RPC12/RpoP